jgi:hypothetical protein
MFLNWMIAVTVGSGPQIGPPVPTFGSEKLRTPDEIARVLFIGGRTARGLFSEVYIVSKKKTVTQIAKTGYTKTLSGDQWKEWELAVKKLDWKGMTAKKAKHPRAAVDGTDIYLGIRQGTKIRYWSTADFEYNKALTFEPLFKKWFNTK